MNTTVSDAEHTSKAKKQSRLWSWFRAVEQDPALEEQATRERRERLLADLNRAVADAPDDTPIREIVRTLNRHADD